MQPNLIMRGGGRTLGDLLDLVYPVGSIYMNVNNINPQSVFGGSWEKVEGKFLLGSSATYLLGTQGGEASHTLTLSEMPKHNHIMTFYTGNPGGFQSGQQVAPTNSITRTTEMAGNNQPHNNLPPYLVVNIWKRVA